MTAPCETTLPSQPSFPPVLSGRLDAETIKLEAERFLSDRRAPVLIPHDEILRNVVNALPHVNFKAQAGIDEDEKLPQKHLLVLVVDQILAEIRKQDLALARKDGSIFGFNGSHWAEMPKDDFTDFLGEAAKKMGVLELDARYYEFKNKLYLQFLASAGFQEVAVKSDVVLLNTFAGTLEIEEDRVHLRGFDPADFLTYRLNFQYDPEAKCPMFDNFLAEALPEKELQDLLAEFLGYSFTKNLKLEKAALFYGLGGNGKSVVFDITNALHGIENVTNFSLTDLMAEHNRALIANKLLNYGSEINAGVTRDIFKTLVSTEPIQARLKYGQSFTMRDYAKLCFNCNELPKDFDHQHAYFRRLIIIPFRHTVPEAKQDKNLAKKIISSELPGVLNWVIAGLKRLLARQRFTDSEIAAEALATYKRESDSVASFLEETHDIVGQSLKITYRDYREHCKDVGSASLGRNNFSKRLDVVHGYMLEKTREGIFITDRREK